MEISPKSWHYSGHISGIISEASSQHLSNSPALTGWRKVSSSLSFQVALIRQLFLLSSCLSEHEMMPLLSISVWFSKSCCQSYSSKWNAHGNWHSHSLSSLIGTDPHTSEPFLASPVWKCMWREEAGKLTERGKVSLRGAEPGSFYCMALWVWTISCVFVSTEHISLQTIWASEMKVSWK